MSVRGILWGKCVDWNRYFLLWAFDSSGAVSRDVSMLRSTAAVSRLVAALYYYPMHITTWCRLIYSTAAYATKSRTQLIKLSRGGIPQSAKSNPTQKTYFSMPSRVIPLLSHIPRNIPSVLSHSFNGVSISVIRP